MITQQTFQTAEHRLAQYYLTRLKQAGKITPRGGENLQYWLDSVQQDWEQIKKWRAWSGDYTSDELEKARLCVAYPLAISSQIRMRQMPSETLVWAQEALNAAQILEDTAAELQLLYIICLMYWNMENIEALEQWVHRLTERATAENDAIGLSRAWGFIGCIKEFRGDYAGAEAPLLQSLEILPPHSTEHDLTNMAWHALGRIALFRGDYEKSADYHQWILEAAQRDHREGAVGVAHLTLSGVYIYQGNYHKAEYHAEQAVRIARRLVFTRFIPAAVMGLAHAKKWLGQYDQACAYYEEALANRHLLTPTNLANALYGFGHAEFFRGNSDAALACFKEALTLVPMSSFRSVCDVSRDTALVYIARNELDAATPHLKTALSSAQQLNTPHFMARALAAAMVFWKQSGKLEQAAVWAGLLRNYDHQLHSTLFNRAVFDELEAELGTELYQATQKKGKKLSLEAVISELLTMFD